MRKFTAVLVIAICILLTFNSSFAQMVDTNIYLPGNYLEIGQNNMGAFGAPTPPAGYHPNPAGPLAEVYDYGHDGWTVGTPPYYGDYTWLNLPAEHGEGWGIQVTNPTSGLNWAITQMGSISGTGSLTGHNVSYTNSGGALAANWAGTTAGGQLAINMQTVLDTNASWVTIIVNLYNTGTTALNNIYYLRSCNASMKYTDISATDFSKKNIIQYQNDSDHRVMVASMSTTNTNDYMALLTIDSKAKAYISPDWPPNYTVTDISTLYSGTSGTTASYDVGTSNVGDYGIGLIFKIGTINAGDSTTFSYDYIFDGDTGIDSITTAVANLQSVRGSVQIFPNPATNQLTIQMSPGAYNSFTITNSIGQEMIHQQLSLSQTNVNVTALSPGLYYITFRGDNGITVQKFVKM